MGIGWVKVLDDGNGSSATLCQYLLDMGIVPIVRLYRSQPNPGQLSSTALDTVRRLASMGVRYFEPNNEPNLRTEWDDGNWRAATWQERVYRVMRDWLADATAIIDAGALPAFPALAQCAHTMTDDAIGSIPFYSEALAYLDRDYNTTARWVFQHGAWLAVHDATLNHCYQDEQGSWHFEYPYDPICQADQPGKSVMDDDNSLIGHRVLACLLSVHLGDDINVPIISTEGGVFMPQNGWQQWDTRYPGYDYAGQALRTVAMLDWIPAHAPELWAMCPWLIANETMSHNDGAWTNDAWYQQDGPMPVVAAMKMSVPQVLPSAQEIRHAAWDMIGEPWNPDAAFQKYATAHNLGYPITSEWDHQGVRIQGFAGGIVYAPIGEWGKVTHIPW